MIVLDASVGVTALVDDGADGQSARSRLRGEVLVVPELFDLEFVSVVRRLERNGVVGQRRAEQALDDLRDLRARRTPHQALVTRCWELRNNLTPYDAAYVAVAELFDAVLLTADARLAEAPGPRCEFEVMR